MPGITTALPYLPTRAARVLGVTTGQRRPAAPDVFTLAEQGYPDLVGHVWYGVLAPADAAAGDRGAQPEINAFVQLPGTDERLRADGSVSMPG
jgi:tripartite-type tricarboxylate transporter receptor subunit TctC